MAARTAFFLSDGTGITAETFGVSTLKQFDVPIRHIRLPFVDTVDKAYQAVRQINHTMAIEGSRPIVFSTLAAPDISKVIHEHCRGLLFDMFSSVVGPLEHELGVKSNHSIGRFADISQSKEYNERIEAINYSLEHDDGQTNSNLEKASVILIGVSRSGKTPTSLYLAMQYGVKTANYPLIPEDFERHALPSALVPFHRKLFGLSIDPVRLSGIRNERRPGSNYASLENCRYEVAESESMMRREGVRWLSTTTKSIEEIATTILQAVKPERL